MKIFSGVWWHFKKYFGIFFSVWLCSWKYNRKHIFYLLLTFSQFPNKYIISFLNRETQKKQNPKKKIHQIRSNWEKKEEREATGFDIEVRSRNGGEGEHNQTRIIGDGFEHNQTRIIGDGFEHNGGAEVAQSNQRWVWAARSDRRGRGSGTGSGLHWQ